MQTQILKNTCSALYIYDVNGFEKYTKLAYYDFIIKQCESGGYYHFTKYKKLFLVTNRKLNSYERLQLRLNTGMKLIDRYMGNQNYMCYVYSMNLNWNDLELLHLLK